MSDPQITDEMARTIIARDHGCLVRLLDPDADRCFGRITLDHVHKGYAMLSRRAAHTLGTLVAVCEWHHGTNRIGGGRSTSKVNRARQRAWLIFHAEPRSMLAVDAMIRELRGEGSAAA